MSGRHMVQRNLPERGSGRTDWKKLRDQSDADIQRAARADADNPIWTKDELRDARLTLPSGEAKVALSIRLDREVIEYFKSQGNGYQSRIGAVLLSYVRTQESLVVTERPSGTYGAKKTGAARKGNPAVKTSVKTSAKSSAKRTATKVKRAGR